MKHDWARERVERLIHIYDSDDGECMNPSIDKDDVIKLLLAERARTRRIAKDVFAAHGMTRDEFLRRLR